MAALSYGNYGTLASGALGSVYKVPYTVNAMSYGNYGTLASGALGSVYKVPYTVNALSYGNYVIVGNRMLLINEELGSGNFGTIYKVHDIDNASICALKAISTSTGRTNIDQALREANTLLAAKHPRVVQILGVDKLQLSASNQLFLILTEICAGGDLNSRLDRPSTDDKNMNWICQISEALSYLHSRCPAIVHRDLKADNVLLTDSFNEDAKLGDFGLAREYVGLKNIDYNGVSVGTYYMSSGTGPIHWMAPEFYFQRYTEKADVFSLGGIFYAILQRDFMCVKPPKKMYGVFINTWQGKVGLGYAMATIDRNAVVTFSTPFRGCNSMQRLIQEMFEYDPHNRPSATEVYERVENIRSSIKLVPQQQNAPAGGGCC